MPMTSREDDFHPGKCLPDCMMPDGGECCPGYIALYDAYWHLVRGGVAQAQPIAPKDLHWLGDRESADATRHAMDMTGCVMYFAQQSDCLQFMRWVSQLSSTNHSSFCEFCDREHQLHEDAQGFHHVVKGERMPCLVTSKQGAGDGK